MNASGIAAPPPRGGGKWSDLARRLISTAVLLGMGVVLAMATGVWLRLAISVLVGVTFWELARMISWRHPETHGGLFGASRPVALAVIAGMSLMVALMSGSNWGMMLLVLPILAGLPGAPERDRLAYALFGLGILLVGFQLVIFREAFGLVFILWLMGVVIVSDTLGYFAGRILGGPKFWPALSPKKTWSGTVAGWIGAALLGLVISLSGAGDAELIWVSPLVCLAGQMGDIAESWLKRRVGVKDSSNLIPGHGGLMDRFDAVCGAVLAVTLIGLAFRLPVVGV